MQELYLRSAQNVFFDYLMLFHFTPKNGVPTLKLQRVKEVPISNEWELCAAEIQPEFLPGPTQALMIRNFILTPWLALRIELCEDALATCSSLPRNLPPLRISSDQSGKTLYPVHYESSWSLIQIPQEQFSTPAEQP